MSSRSNHFGIFSAGGLSGSAIGLLILLTPAASRNALAQPTGSIGPDHAAPLTGRDEVPPGGCTPIGVTASGEIVFPITCRAFLERRRGPIDEPKPADPTEKPAQAEKVEPPAVVPAPAAVPAKSEPVVQPPDDVDTTSSIDGQKQAGSRDTKRRSRAKREPREHPKAERRHRTSSPDE